MSLTFDQWVGLCAAGGTVFAAIVALYLARRSERVRLKVWVGYRRIVGGINEEVKEAVTINVTNIGSRAVFINSVFWSIGLWKFERLCFQKERNMPRRLEYGESTSMLTEFEKQLNPLQELITGLEITKTSLRFLRVQIVTSVGYIKKARPERSLLERIEVLLEQNEKGGC